MNSLINHIVMLNRFHKPKYVVCLTGLWDPMEFQEMEKP